MAAIQLHLGSHYARLQWTAYYTDTLHRISVHFWGVDLVVECSCHSFKITELYVYSTGLSIKR